MKRILIIDDDGTCKRGIVENLKHDDRFTVETVEKKNALKLFEKCNDYNLIIINIATADTSVWSISREIKKISAVPIIVLCSEHDDIYELYGFEMGIDDFVRKPYNPQVLIARIRAIFKRMSPTTGTTIHFNDIELDISGHSIFLRGTLLPLRPKEYDLLKYMIEHQEVALKREQILQHVWNYDYVGYQRTIDSHIKKLRKKLGEKGNCIKTVRNVGYKLTTNN